MAHKFPIAMKVELDSPQRKKLLNPVKTLRALGIRAGMIVADVGCGTGFFTKLYIKNCIIFLIRVLFSTPIRPEIIKEHMQAYLHLKNI